MYSVVISTEATMLICVLTCNLFVLLWHKILGQTERVERMKILRYRRFVLPVQLGGDGSTSVAGISVFSQEAQSELLYLNNRKEQYFPP